MILLNPSKIIKSAHKTLLSSKQKKYSIQTTIRSLHGDQVHFLCVMDISFTILENKNISPGSPDKDSQLTGSCYNTSTRVSQPSVSGGPSTRASQPLVSGDHSIRMSPPIVSGDPSTSVSKPLVSGDPSTRVFQLLVSGDPSTRVSQPLVSGDPSIRIYEPSVSSNPCTMMP